MPARKKRCDRASFSPICRNTPKNVFLAKQPPGKEGRDFRRLPKLVAFHLAAFLFLIFVLPREPSRVVELLPAPPLAATAPRDAHSIQNVWGATCSHRRGVGQVREKKKKKVRTCLRNFHSMIVD
jgi:hypothetical protein